MRFPIAAACALISASALHAQTAAPAAPTNFTYATPLIGTWFYSPATDGSEAIFLDTSARPQLIIHCTRATRRVSIAKPAAGAAPFLLIWTSSQTRNAPASFDPTTSRLSSNFAATDPLLDALSFSRGRIAVSVTGTPALIAPPWPEIARVVEDCRS
jgi:hypothetical protein